MQIEEDTDRDRYMSPLEAKNYGLIDEVIGGDEAGFQITGTTRDFPKTKESYVNWVRSLVTNLCFCGDSISAGTACVMHVLSHEYCKSSCQHAKMECTDTHPQQNPDSHLSASA